ncbi:MAG: phosphodiester glycosidase family protein [Methylovirgula sp.]
MNLVNSNSGRPYNADVAGSIEPRTRRLLGRLGILLLVLGSVVAGALEAQAASAGCRAITDDEVHYVVCSYDMRQNKRGSELRLYLADPKGQPYGGFAALEADLEQRGQSLLFGMNGGMYGDDLKPVGLLIEAGHQIHPVNERSGSGNFHLKPNGVFYFGARTADVMETQAFVTSGLRPDYATQSGPMLVIDGMIHPKIEATGTSEKIRNGVGVRDGHIVDFVISEDPVTFYRFAVLFRDRLSCPNALYLDGSISSLYAPGLGRTIDGLRPIGPIIAIVQKRS